MRTPDRLLPWTLPVLCATSAAGALICLVAGVLAIASRQYLGAAFDGVGVAVNGALFGWSIINGHNHQVRLPELEANVESAKKTAAMLTTQHALMQQQLAETTPAARRH